MACSNARSMVQEKSSPDLRINSMGQTAKSGWLPDKTAAVLERSLVDASAKLLNILPELSI